MIGKSQKISNQQLKFSDSTTDLCENIQSCVSFKVKGKNMMNQAEIEKLLISAFISFTCDYAKHKGLMK